MHPPTHPPNHTHTHTHTHQIAPSVQGLDSKVLKNSLKKENCYTTVMTTARIRGTEKVYVTDLSEQKLYQVTDGMTFAQLIAVVCGSGRVSLDLLKNWYLFDTGKGTWDLGEGCGGGVPLLGEVCRVLLGKSGYILSHTSPFPLETVKLTVHSPPPPLQTSLF